MNEYELLALWGLNTLCIFACIVSVLSAFWAFKWYTLYTHFKKSTGVKVLFTIFASILHLGLNAHWIYTQGWAEGWEFRHIAMFMLSHISNAVIAFWYHEACATGGKL